MHDKIKARLASLGFENLVLSDNEAERAIALSGEILKTETNRSSVPEGLIYVQADIAAGLILKDKKMLIMQNDDFGFSDNVKSVSEGEVSVTFAGGAEGAKAPEARLDELINSLLMPDNALIVSYRRLSW